MTIHLRSLANLSIQYRIKKSSRSSVVLDVPGDGICSISTACLLASFVDEIDEVHVGIDLDQAHEIQKMQKMLSI